MSSLLQVGKIVNSIAELSCVQAKLPESLSPKRCHGRRRFPGTSKSEVP